MPDLPAVPPDGTPKGTTPTTTEPLDRRTKRVDLYSKIRTIKRDELKAEQEAVQRGLSIKEQQFKMAKLEAGKEDSLFSNPTAVLMRAMEMIIIDNDKTISSEYVLKSLWTEEEMYILKQRLLKKLDKL